MKIASKFDAPDIRAAQMDMTDPAMSAVAEKTPNLNDPHLVSLEAYWRTLRHARRIPARSDLNPAQIDHALPYSFILQKVAPATARFRVAGQQIHHLLKMDARGMPLSAVFEPKAHASLRKLVTQAFDNPAIVGLPLISHGSLLRPTLQGAMLLMPMQDAQGATTRLLGAFVYTQHTLPRPRRFVIDDTQALRCEPLGPQLATAQAVADLPNPIERPHAVQRPALRLVVNND